MCVRIHNLAPPKHASNASSSTRSTLIRGVSGSWLGLSASQGHIASSSYQRYLGYDASGRLDFLHTGWFVLPLLNGVSRKSKLLGFAALRRAPHFTRSRRVRLQPSQAVATSYSILVTGFRTAPPQLPRSTRRGLLAFSRFAVSQYDVVPIHAALWHVRITPRRASSRQPLGEDTCLGRLIWRSILHPRFL